MGRRTARTARLGAGAGASLLIAALAACGSDTTVVTSPESKTSEEPAAGDGGSGGASASERTGGPRDLDALFANWHQLDVFSSFSLDPVLPNRHYRFADGTRALTDAVVLGLVRAVEPDRGFVNGPEEDGGDQIPLEDRDVGFDDPKADWSTVRLTVDVLERFGDDQPIEDTIEVGMSGSADRLPALRDALIAQPAVVMFLDKDSPVFDYDDNLFAVAANNTTLATVAPDGSLHLAGLDAYRDKRQLQHIETLDKLRASAAEPVEVRPWPTEHPCSLAEKRRPDYCG